MNNNNSDTFSLAGRVRSIQHAVNGIAEMLKSEHNAWVHLFATMCTISTAYLLDVNATEWCFLILAIMAVWVSEALNTAFEFLCERLMLDGNSQENWQSALDELGLTVELKQK